MDIFTKLYNTGIVPVIKIDDVKDAVPLAKALMSGGLDCAEITFRTAAGKDAIRQITENIPEMLVGAGTVLTIPQVDDAVNSGAKFIVSPGLNPRVVEYCVKKDIPVLPGCSSPSDIETAIELGLTAVKFFPAEQAGGLDYIKAVSAPYTSIRFMPTGGINEKNFNKYLNFDKVIACGGSWMVKDELIRSGSFDEIEALTKAAVNIMHGFELAHVGINTENRQEAERVAKQFELLFGFTARHAATSVFAGSYIECMSEPNYGKHGHIAIAVNYLNRAVARLENMGFTFNQQSRKFDDKGNMTAIYLNDEIAGFAVHIVQK